MKALISAFIDNKLQTVVIYHEEGQQDLLGKLVNNFNTYGKLKELFKGHILSIDKDGTIHPIDFNLNVDNFENWEIENRYVADINVIDCSNIVFNIVFGWRKVDVKTNVTKKYESIHKFELNDGLV